MRWRVSALVTIAAALCGCARMPWVSRDFRTARTGMDTLSIIFPRIEYSVKSGDVSTPKSGYSVFVSQAVADAMKRVIDGGGYIPKAAVVVCDTAWVSRWLSAGFSPRTGQHRPLWDSLQASEDGRKFFPANGQFSEIKTTLTTRYFLYVSGVAFGTTEATKQFDLQQRSTFKVFYDRPLTYEYQWQGLSLELALVDGQSGEVIWYNANDPRESNYDPLDQEQVETLCASLLGGDAGGE